MSTWSDGPEIQARVRAALHDEAARVRPLLGLRDLLDRIRARPLRPCPVSSCPRSVPAHRLMCRPHWGMVPPALKQALADARLAAIRSVTDLEGPPPDA